MVKSMLQPALAMPLGQEVPALLDQLERLCLAPDGMLVSKPAFLDLLQEMARERLRYLEAMAVYGEAVALVEEYEHGVCVANVGGIRDLNTVLDQLDLRSSP